MPIKRPLIAVSLATVVALAGCTPEESGEDEATEQNNEADENAEDAPQMPGEDGEMDMPEPDVDDIPDIVAEVNGDEIDNEEFVANYEGQFQQAAMQQQQQGGGDLDQDELKQQVAQQLVDNRLLTQAAEDSGIEATDDDIEATLEDLATQNGMESADEVVDALTEQGTSEDQIRKDAASQFQVDKFIDDQADIDEPSEDELREQYDELVDQMGGEEGAEEEIPSFDEMRDQLADQATGEQQNEAVQGILDDLHEDADVTINL